MILIFYGMKFWGHRDMCLYFASFRHTGMDYSMPRFAFQARVVDRQVHMFAWLCSVFCFNYLVLGATSFKPDNAPVSIASWQAIIYSRGLVFFCEPPWLRYCGLFVAIWISRIWIEAKYHKMWTCGMNHHFIYLGKWFECLCKENEVIWTRNYNVKRRHCSIRVQQAFSWNTLLPCVRCT